MHLHRIDINEYCIIMSIKAIVSIFSKNNIDHVISHTIQNI